MRLLPSFGSYEDIILGEAKVFLTEFLIRLSRGSRFELSNLELAKEFKCTLGTAVCWSRCNISLLVILGETPGL